MNKVGIVKNMQTLYKALLMGQVIFVCLAVLARSRGMAQTVSSDVNRIMQVFALVCGFAAIWFALWYYRKRIAAIKDANITVSEKMEQYRTASIIKWALTEGPCIFCIVFYFLTGNWAFLALAGIIIFVFAGYNPNKALVMRELGLGEDELL